MTAPSAHARRGTVCRRIAEAPSFQRAVVAVIVLSAVAMGLETFPTIRSSFPAAFDAFFLASQAFFVAEIAIRIGSFGRRPQDFFRDPWNAFDFAVVAVSIVPAVGPLAIVARVARVLRVLRVVSASAELRTIVATMLRSIPSMAHVVLLLGIVLFVYGMVGHHLFGATDPDHWGTIWRAAQTLFVVITLEGWVEIMAAAGTGAWTWLYFASFIVVAVFVVINLFIAVVINNLETVRAEERARDPAAAEPGHDLAPLRWTRRASYARSQGEARANRRRRRALRALRASVRTVDASA